MKCSTYKYCGGSDSPCQIVDASTNSTQTVVALPGGTTYTETVSGTGPTIKQFIYSNIHGDTSAIANDAGVKQGSTAPMIHSATRSTCHSTQHQATLITTG